MACHDSAAMALSRGLVGDADALLGAQRGKEAAP